MIGIAKNPLFCRASLDPLALLENEVISKVDNIVWVGIRKMNIIAAKRLGRIIRPMIL